MGRRKKPAPWPGYPKPNHTRSIPVHLIAEYADYWRQWYGREARAQRQAAREGWVANR